MLLLLAKWTRLIRRFVPEPVGKIRPAGDRPCVVFEQVFEVLGLGFCQNKHAWPNAFWRCGVFSEAYGLTWKG